MLCVGTHQDHISKDHQNRSVSFQDLENGYAQKGTFLAFPNLKMIQNENVTRSINDDDLSKSKRIQTCTPFLCTYLNVYSFISYDLHFTLQKWQKTLVRNLMTWNRFCILFWSWNHFFKNLLRLTLFLKRENRFNFRCISIVFYSFNLNNFGKR